MLDQELARHPEYGPATVADVTTWSRLTGLREVVDRLRPHLRALRDERGRELFDAPDGPRPDPDTPAPPRFLPECDNAVPSSADRTRFVSDEDRARLNASPGPVHGSVLHDGFLCATWRTDRDPTTGRTTLVVNHLERLQKKAIAAVAAEGRRLLGFIAADADSHDVRLDPL